MLSGFKFYLLLVFVLIGAHVVVAGEKVVDFQRALNDFRKERKPQIERQEAKAPSSEDKKFINPPVEVRVPASEQKE